MERNVALMIESRNLQEMVRLALQPLNVNCTVLSGDEISLTHHDFQVCILDSNVSGDRYAPMGCQAIVIHRDAIEPQLKAHEEAIGPQNEGSSEQKSEHGKNVNDDALRGFESIQHLVSPLSVDLIRESVIAALQRREECALIGEEKMGGQHDEHSHIEASSLESSNVNDPFQVIETGDNLFASTEGLVSAESLVRKLSTTEFAESHANAIKNDASDIVHVESFEDPFGERVTRRVTPARAEDLLASSSVYESPEAERKTSLATFEPTLIEEPALNLSLEKEDESVQVGLAQASEAIPRFVDLENRISEEVEKQADLYFKNHLEELVAREVRKLVAEQSERYIRTELTRLLDDVE